MSRLTRIDDLLFPVKEYPVFANIKTQSSERQIPVPDKKALINTKTNRVLGVVSRGYRLVTNSEALDLAHECCIKVFPETKASEWIVDVSDAPQSGGHCFFDLLHKTAKLDFSSVSPNNRPDTFGPFIRVTNSYNGLRALTFDIGFYRKVCKNGLIVPKSIIRFKFTHLQRDIGNQITFEINHDQLSKLKSDFNDYFGVLLKCAVPYSDFNPLLQGVLRIHKPKDIEKKYKLADDWKNLSIHLNDLCKKYSEDLGENAYSAFNAITDFASHPLENRCIHRERHSFQRLAGEWLSEFHNVCSAKDFKLSEYLVKLVNTPEKQN